MCNKCENEEEININFVDGKIVNSILYLEYEAYSGDSSFYYNT